MWTIQSMRRREAWLLAAGIAGFLVGLAPDTITSISPTAPDPLRAPAATFVLVLAAVGATAALIAWACVGAHPARVTFVTVSLGAGTFAALIQALALAVGWWGGTAFQAPLLPLALSGTRGGFPMAAHLGLVIFLYVLVARRHPRLGLLVYGAFMLAVIPGTIVSDRMFLGDGTFAFRHGYSIGTDILYAEVLFGFPLVLYTLLRRPRPRFHPERPERGY